MWFRLKAIKSVRLINSVFKQRLHVTLYLLALVIQEI